MKTTIFILAMSTIVYATPALSDDSCIDPNIINNRMSWALKNMASTKKNFCESQEADCKALEDQGTDNTSLSFATVNLVHTVLNYYDNKAMCNDVQRSFDRLDGELNFYRGYFAAKEIELSNLTYNTPDIKSSLRAILESLVILIPNAGESRYVIADPDQKSVSYDSLIDRVDDLQDGLGFAF